MSTKEKEILEIISQLSPTGQVDLLVHGKTILRAEAGIKKQYGLDAPKKEEGKDE